MTERVKPAQLVARLTSDNPTWRVDAEAQLIALGAEAVELLIRALGHANPAVRIHALHALGVLRDPRAIAPLVLALGDADQQGAAAIAAEKALVEWGEPVKAALLEVVRSGPEAVRPRALRAVGRIGGADLEPALRALLTDRAPAIRTQAAAGLTALLGPAAIEVVAPLLADPDKWVRYGVAEALVQVGCTRGEKVLQAAQEDPEERGSHVQFWAAELLDQISELRRTARAVP